MPKGEAGKEAALFRDRGWRVSGYLVLAPGVGFVDDWRAGRLDGEEDEGVVLQCVSGLFFVCYHTRCLGILNACWTCRTAVDSP